MEAQKQQERQLREVALREEARGRTAERAIQVDERCEGVKAHRQEEQLRLGLAYPYYYIPTSQ
jgi:hypothetical protein